MSNRLLKILLAGGLAMSLVSPLKAQTTELSMPSIGEPTLSADGRLIGFVSGGDIWEVDATGGSARLLVSDPATESRPRYSPDGRYLAFTSTRGGNANIYSLDLTTGITTRLTYAESNEDLNDWSADGRWIYFSSGVNDVGR